MTNYIKIRGAGEHNLQNIDVDIPKYKLVVVTGKSGSGKSSLVYNTIYVESIRAYLAGFPVRNMQFFSLQNKSDVKSITGLSPAIAIDQKTVFRNPRSTVGTITDIYGYLRLLFAKIGIAHSPATNLPLQGQKVSDMVDIICNLFHGIEVYILIPLVQVYNSELRREVSKFKKRGFLKLIIDNYEYEIDSLPVLDKQKKYNISVVVDQLVIDSALRDKINSSIESALQLSNGVIHARKVSSVAVHNIDIQYSAQDQDVVVLSEKYSCPVSGLQLPKIEPRIFSFNSPFGTCNICKGLGKEMVFSPSLIVSDSSLSIAQGAILPWANNDSSFFKDTFSALAQHYNFSLNDPIEKLSDKVKNILFYGSGNEKIKFEYNSETRPKIIVQPFGGIIPSLEEKYCQANTQWLKDELSRYQVEGNCRACGGSRLAPESLCVKIANLNISEVAQMRISDAYDWLSKLEHSLTEKQRVVAKLVIREIKNRLSFIKNVGLEYLTIDRSSTTLSGGESQRIRLASQIGSGLSGIIYILDEPSIGLHQSDNKKLISTLKNLKNLGNSLIVVEHDKEIMLEADHIIDIGPSAGAEGGKIVAQGQVKDIINVSESITGQYLSGKKFIPIPSNIRAGNNNKFIELKGARAHNLKNVNVKIPLGTFTVVTGVSGSGKSTLVNTLYKAILKKLEPSTRIHVGEYATIMGLDNIDKVINIDQSPIGKTPRSNPATYSEVFDCIRDWFSELEEAKDRGYKRSRFSFNVNGGRCEACEGCGLTRIEMHFLPDVFVNCDVCDGKRYNRETLEVKYNGKSIADVLSMTVEEAIKFFGDSQHICDKLKTLNDVGLGYIKIGQSATTLSGGEAQRVKLAKELSKRSTGKTLYVLDEPTTGLHFEDIDKLLQILHKLVDKGNTVLVIEHNIDVIKSADYIIDVGLGGGDKGGVIVASGTPKQVAFNDQSITGTYLKEYFRE
ncbi:excinuclease ABC subunit A [Orientia chuto str. Dubai]|uniref:UvrABC system protein A n=1 Tax=Orientia chuto str. Dubai TaxID=1359168 RepID=A0A0F3MHT6_9RICK|nr:excinuclease ABC subunit UvrA [Candidatus Orientia mediorientalis]KJV55320.1 excinuclease ABC subunit A [Orientia chuto str. Dubai]